MGYETTLLIGVQTTSKYYNPDFEEMTDDYNWFHVYATVDLCVTKDIFRYKTDRTPAYFYDMSDGNKQVIKDGDGEKLQAYPIGKIIKQLENSDLDYMRHKWALALLKSMQETAGENLQVLIYGH